MTTEIYLNIVKYLRRLIEGTKWEGHVFTVGGCCRDRQLGLEIKDVDLAVDLPMGGVEFATWLWKKHLTCFRPVIFKRYGTAMTRLKAFPHDDIEIVQTRAEKYTDHNSRNPETAFGSLEDDCYRRDLTINSLYYDISRDRMLDITGRAIHDIKCRHIDTPTDPDATYDDDPVRILRTIRFATRLDWQIPERIMEAMKRNAPRLDIIKVERMRGEFEKMLLGPRPGRALELMNQVGVLDVLMPELKQLCELPLEGEPGTVWDHTLRTLNGIKEPDIALRMGALLHDMGKPASYSPTDSGEPRYPRHELRVQAPVMQILERLKYHSPFMKEVVFLCRHHTAARHWGRDGEKISDRDLRHLQYNCVSPSRFRALITLIDAINHAHSCALAKRGQGAAIMLRDEQMQAEGSAMYEYHLPFGERRIKNLKQMKSGPQVADCISFLMKEAYKNPLRSREQFEQLLLDFTPTHGEGVKGKNYPVAVQPMPDALVPLPGCKRGAGKEFGIPDSTAKALRRKEARKKNKVAQEAEAAASKQNKRKHKRGKRTKERVSEEPAEAAEAKNKRKKRRHHRSRRRKPAEKMSADKKA